MKYRNEYPAISGNAIKISAGKKVYRPSLSLAEYIEHEFKLGSHDFSRKLKQTSKHLKSTTLN